MGPFHCGGQIMGLIPSNKRGVFFTFTAILLVTLLFISYSSILNEVSKKNQYSETIRIESMNSFLVNLEQEASNAIYTASFRSMISIIESITSTGIYVSDYNSAMIELMTLGTQDGTSSFLMDNNTLIYWISKMDEQAQKIGIDLTLEFTNISISHSDPWTVNIESSIHTILRDRRDIAYWNTTFKSSAEISVLGFEDPVFIVNSGNQLSRRVNISPHYRNFTSLDNINEEVSSGYYIPFVSAPSYLMRLEGNLTSSIFGIESLVDKDELSKFIPVNDFKSNVDYIYFSNIDPPSFEISGISGEFRMDNETGLVLTHLEEYNLTKHIT